MKYTEDNLAEIISTEMFVKGITFMSYQIEMQVLERDLDKYKNMGLKWMQFWGSISLGTEAMLSLKGYKVEKTIHKVKDKQFKVISWDIDNK